MSNMEKALAWAEHCRKTGVSECGSSCINLDHVADAFNAGYLAHAAASQPVKIEDIPEEWVNEEVDIWWDGVRQSDCVYRFVPDRDQYEWISRDGDFLPQDELTYAMLPPTINTEDS